MPKFLVNLYQVAGMTTVEVEAENPQEASQTALSIVEGGMAPPLVPANCKQVAISHLKPEKEEAKDA